MGYKNIWAPWRYGYIKIADKKQQGCLFCNIVRDGKKSERKNLVILFTRRSFIVMNKYPYTTGHIMIVPRKHTSTLTSLSDEEILDMFSLVRKSEKVLRKCLKCSGINIGLNIGKSAGAGIASHIHVHMVPRWVGDTNYMTTVSHIRVIPQDINDTYKSLKEQFNRNNDSTMEKKNECK